jgi:hypothetical protein
MRSVLPQGSRPTQLARWGLLSPWPGGSVHRRTVLCMTVTPARSQAPTVGPDSLRPGGSLLQVRPERRGSVIGKLGHFNFPRRQSVENWIDTDLSPKGFLRTLLPIEQSLATGDQANSIGPLRSPVPEMAALVHRSPSARAGDLWRSIALRAGHSTARDGTAVQRGALPGTCRPAFQVSAGLIDRQAVLAIYGDLWHRHPRLAAGLSSTRTAGIWIVCTYRRYPPQIAIKVHCKCKSN